MLSPMCLTNLKTNLKYNFICVSNQTIEIENNKNGDKLILLNVTRTFVNNVLPGIFLAIKSCLRDRSSLCWVEIREEINSRNNLVLEFTSIGKDKLKLTKFDIVNSALADMLPKRRVKKDMNLSRDSNEDVTSIFKCPSTLNGENTTCVGGITSTENRPGGCPRIKNLKTTCLSRNRWGKTNKTKCFIKIIYFKSFIKIICGI